MKDIHCYDVENDRCPNCDKKESCSLWQNTQEIVKAIESGFIGYIKHPNGTITPLRQETRI